MNKKGSAMFKTSASMRELKNRNSLATLRLTKEIYQYEAQQKLLVRYMEKDRVSQYAFLRDVRVCETNLNPHYHKLLVGKQSNGRFPNGLRKSRKTAQTAPPCNRTGSKELSPLGTGTLLPPRAAVTAVPRHIKSQQELIRQNRRKLPSSHDQAEEFLKHLRKKDVEEDILLKGLTETNIETIIVKRIQDGLLKVPRPSKVVGSLPSECWAGPRESAFYSFSKSDHDTIHQPNETPQGRAETLNMKPNSGKVVGLIQRESSSNLDVETDDTVCQSIFKRKPVELRIHEFLEKIAILKKEQEDRLQQVTSWEKRRRWICLTKGNKSTLGESDSENEE